MTFAQRRCPSQQHVSMHTTFEPWQDARSTVVIVRVLRVGTMQVPAAGILALPCKVCRRHLAVCAHILQNSLAPGRDTAGKALLHSCLHHQYTHLHISGMLQETVWTGFHCLGPCCRA